MANEAQVATKNDINEMVSLHRQMLDTMELNAKQFREADQTVTDKVAKLNSRLDEIEIAHQRAVNANNARTAADTAIKNFNQDRKDAYVNFVQKGRASMSPEHVKLLTSEDATTGGFLIVPEVVPEIIKAIILMSPVRNYAKVRQTQSNAVKVPKRTGTFAAVWTNEVQQQTEAVGLKYGMEEVPNHPMTAFSDISMEDVEDSMFDMPAELNSEFAEQFAKAEGAAFVVGTGKGQPEGFMTNAAIASDKTANSTSLTYTGYVNCLHNLKTAYAKNSMWFLNRQTIGATRLLVDGQNRPLWQPMAQSGLPDGNVATILGLPYAEIPDMPNVGAGLCPIAVGDWKRAYLIVDRISISVVRDDITQASRGVIRFLARKRVGGQVVLTEAIRKIVVST